MVTKKFNSNFIKDNLKFVIVFLLALFVLIFFGHINSFDSIWNYGFSYAFAIGETPYVDFNMITPGFYNFIMSLGLHLSHNNLVMLFEQAFLITVVFYIVYKMYGKMAWLFLFFMSFPKFYVFSLTYNFFILLLTILIVYLEKEKKSDYLIGFLLGLCILTKHTVGVFLVIPSFIFYFKDKKKLFKRFIGCLVPCVIFVIYLLIIGAFKEFFDLCILGLFDFASKNSEMITEYVIGSLLLFAFNIVYIIFNKKDILGYYVICFFSVMLPIFTHYHFCLYLTSCSLLLLAWLKKSKISVDYIGTLGIILTVITFSFHTLLIPYKFFLKTYNFNYLYVASMDRDEFNSLNRLYLKYKDLSNTNMVSSISVLVKISNEERLDYFMVPLTGNFGYNGTKKMINKVKNTGRSYYIIDMSEYKNTKKYSGQFDVELCDYIINNSELVEKKGNYEVFLKN